LGWSIFRSVFIVILAGFEGEDVVDFISPSGTVFFISWSREGKGREEKRKDTMMAEGRCNGDVVDERGSELGM
jgi:hypothetical protein